MIRNRGHLRLLLMLSCILIPTCVSAQKFGLKTNILYDATTTLNLGVEFGLGRRWTMEATGSYNIWMYSKNKANNFLVQPEARFWFFRRFSGSFVGMHFHYGMYDIGGALPFGLSMEELDAFRFQGWLAGGGFSYGYDIVLGNRWNLELTLGLGYAYVQYDKYRLDSPETTLGQEIKFLFGPTKAGISLIYLIK